jgi:hypothetical protein
MLHGIRRQSIKRATAAIEAQEALMRKTDQLDSREERIAGLIADLMHLAKDSQEFERALAHARDSYAWETGNGDLADVVEYYN